MLVFTLLRYATQSPRTHQQTVYGTVISIVFKAPDVFYTIGTTRDNFDGKKVLKLEYEAYSPMAEKEMKKICHSVRGKWPDVENIAMFHRIGYV